jgi:hypothetical protein
MAPFKKMAYGTCWQFMNCPIDMRVQCIVYKTNMKEPWWVSNDRSGRSILGTYKTCPLFLKNNPEFVPTHDLLP